MQQIYKWIRNQFTFNLFCLHNLLGESGVRRTLRVRRTPPLIPWRRRCHLSADVGFHSESDGGHSYINAIKQTTNAFRQETQVYFYTRWCKISTTPTSCFEIFWRIVSTGLLDISWADFFIVTMIWEQNMCCSLKMWLNGSTWRRHAGAKRSPTRWGKTDRVAVLPHNSIF